MKEYFISPRLSSYKYIATIQLCDYSNMSRNSATFKFTLKKLHYPWYSNPKRLKQTGTQGTL